MPTGLSRVDLDIQANTFADAAGNTSNPGAVTRSRMTGLLKKIEETNGIAVFFAVLILYFTLWAVTNWPALTKPWLYLDDYHKVKYVSTVLPFETGVGRPVVGLWFQTFYLDGHLDHPIYNILFRLFHGLFHTLAATLAAILIWKYSRRWIALLSVIPFLIWPFNGEAVLWRSAAGYPIAAFLSILGVCLIHVEGRYGALSKACGVFFIAASLLSNQLAAFAGLILFLFLVALDAEPQPLLSKKRIARFLMILSGYLVGGGASIILLRYFNPGLQRAKFVSDIVAKAKFIARLNLRFVTSPDFYPDWLVGLHAVLLAGAAVLLLWVVSRRFRSSPHLILTGLVFASLAVVPYTSSILTAESWSSWRLMYLAPFLFVMALNVLGLCLDSFKKAQVIPVLILGLLVVGYVPIGRVNASEYVELFEEDMRVLRQFETTAEDWGAERVTVATFPDYIHDWDPYDLRYHHSDSKLSAYIVEYSWFPFINTFSDLVTIDGEEKKACAAVCQSVPQETPFEYHLLEQSNTLCMCP